MPRNSEAKKEANRAYMEEAKKEGLTTIQKLTAAIYPSAPYFWYLKNIRMPFTSKESKDRYANHYHGKVLTLDQAEAIVNIDRDIPMRDLEQVIPYDTARNFVLSAPTDVVVIECPCRKALGVTTEPNMVCFAVGKPFTDIMLAKWPGRSRRLTREEALDIIEQEHARGHIHTAYFKDAMLNRFYGLCNCGKDTCLGIRMMTQYHADFLAPSGYSIKVDSEACNTCGKCVDVCPFDAVLKDGKTMVYDAGKCMGCGVCVEACPKHARMLVRDETKGDPLDVRAMEREVAQKVIPG